MSEAAPSTMLKASLCGSCGRHVVPPRLRCPRCGGKMEDQAVEGKGNVLSYTTVHVTPDGVPSPRTVALVGLDCGASVLCIVEGTQELAIEMRVEVTSSDGIYRLIWPCLPGGQY